MPRVRSCRSVVRRWRSAAQGETGAAALEFIVVGTLLLVPLVYLVIALGTVQSHALGAEAAARHLARSMSTAGDTATAAERVDRVLAAVIDEYGMDDDDVTVDTFCVPSAATCPAPGAMLTVTVSTRARLPLIPTGTTWTELASIPVEASSVQKVSRFWGAR